MSPIGGPFDTFANIPKAPPMQGESEIEARECLTRVGIRKPMAEAVSSIADAITAAEARGHERGIEDAALEVERQTTMHREKIAAAIRSLRNKE